MKSSWRVAGVIGLVTIAVVACGGGRSESEAPSMPAPPVCGVRLFESPQCENAVNFMCCSQKVECSRDPACQRLADCSVACKHAEAHDTCVTTCVTREAPSPDVERGLALWHRVNDCASKANVPDCGDAS
ncbi:hypothetical protein [Labilithrix luteola]|nr:hypothetical protein [Labilithrix luteola]